MSERTCKEDLRSPVSTSRLAPPDSLYFSESFWTDSDVHISKLSDMEFERSREILTHQVEDFDKSCSNRYKAEGYESFNDIINICSALIEKRASVSLLLPEPCFFDGLEDQHILAIISKMHSRAFVRSMRLCKYINALMNKNLTKFSIRINHASLILNDVRDTDGDEQLALSCRSPLGSKQLKISDPCSILPFSFDSCQPWDGSFYHLLHYMKWPLRNPQISWKEGKAESEMKSWMMGASIICPDLTQLHKCYKTLEPKIMSIETEQPVSDAVLEDLLHSFSCLELRDSYRDPYRDVGFDTDGSDILEKLPIVDIVKKWQSGSWTYKTNTFELKMECEVDDFLDALSGPHTYSHKTPEVRANYWISRLTTILVANPDNVYLIMTIFTRLTGTACTGTNYLTAIRMQTNVRMLSDLVHHGMSYLANTSSQFSAGYSGFRPVIDLSGYSEDPDAPLDPQAFCDLLRVYDSKR